MVRSPTITSLPQTWFNKTPGVLCAIFVAQKYTARFGRQQVKFLLSIIAYASNRFKALGYEKIPHQKMALFTNDLDGKTSMCRSAKNVGSQNRGVANAEKGAARFNEAYPVGPQKSYLFTDSKRI